MLQLANRVAAVAAANPAGWNSLYNAVTSNARDYMYNSRANQYTNSEAVIRDYDTSRRKISNRSPQSETRSSPTYFKARSSRRSYNNLRKYGYYAKKKTWKR
jgi:negative regulator of sigma E activity